jgi:hypothetical protein
MVNLSKKKLMLASVVLQCTHLLDPTVVHDRGYGEAGRLGDCSTTTAPMELALVNSDNEIELNGRIGNLVRMLWFRYGHYLKCLALCIA